MSESEHEPTPPHAPGGVPAAPGPAVDDLLPTVYEELHALAAAILHRSRIVEPTRTTSLVQDVYVKLANRGLRFNGRSHFLCLAARAMRMVLIDRARRENAAKRGGASRVLSLDDGLVAAASGHDLLAVEEALTRLSAFDDRKGRVVELRFFGGLSVEETGRVLGISAASVKREWALARAWLLKELDGAGRPGAG